MKDTEVSDPVRDHEIELIGLSIVAFLVALPMPVADGTSPFGPVRGFSTLMMVPFPPWWANPLLLAAWICSWRRWTPGTAVCGGLALLLGLSAMLFLSDVLPFDVGYYAWLLSLALAFVAGIIAPLARPMKCGVQVGFSALKVVRDRRAAEQELLDTLAANSEPLQAMAVQKLYDTLGLTRDTLAAEPALIRIKVHSVETVGTKHWIVNGTFQNAKAPAATRHTPWKVYLSVSFGGLYANHIDVDGKLT